MLYFSNNFFIIVWMAFIIHKKLKGHIVDLYKLENEKSVENNFKFISFTISSLLIAFIVLLTIIIVIEKKRKNSYYSDDQDENENASNSENLSQVSH